MPKSSTINILSISDSEFTKKPESKGYNWKTLTKAGLVFVATTGVFLTLKATKSFNLIASWLKNRKISFDERETKLAVPEETEGLEAYSEYQRTDLSLTGFEPSETLQTDTLRLTNFKESSLAAVKDSHEHVTFVSQRSKRNPTEILEKIGPEFQVNTYTTSEHWYPSVAGLSNGKFVVTWENYGQDGDDFGIYGQMYNADGTKFLSEFQVNTYTTEWQDVPSIAGLSDGKFVVTWESYGQDGSSYGIYGQIYNADGSKYLSEFQVNTYTTSVQSSPSVAKLSDGKFVVTWQSNSQDGDWDGIYGQMYNADGSKYLSEFQVNTYTTNFQNCPSVARLSNDKFVVTWDSFKQDGDGSGIYGQIFNPDGSKFLSEFQVNTYTTDNQYHSSVAGLSDGKFVVIWVSNDQDGDLAGVYGQMYNADGTKFLSEFQVNTYTTDRQNYPSVAGLSDGKFVVTWESEYQDGDLAGVYGQMYNADGSKYLSEFQANTYTTNEQASPSVEGLSDGKFVVTWDSYGQDEDGNKTSVYGQMFRAYDSFVSSSSRQIPESSSEVSKYSPTASSFETSSFTTTSNIEISSYSSEQSASSIKKSSSSLSSSSDQSTSPVKRSSSSQIIPQSSLSSLDSIETSGSYNSISSTLETSRETNSLSEEPIYSDSIHDTGLSSGEITGIVLGAIATVGLCVAGGFFAIKRICKSNQDQLTEDVELDLTIPKTFRCSLTGKMMNEPVEIAGERDRFYDREAIEQYFAKEHKSPSGKSLKKLVLIPNYDLRSKIDEYKETLEQPSAPQLEV